MDKIKNKITILIVLVSNILFSQNFEEKEIALDAGNQGYLYGTLLHPAGKQDHKVLTIIVAGSGPTDRNGNSSLFINNHLKQLSESLESKNIPTFRFDKRGIGKSEKAINSEEELIIDTYKSDLLKWINFFKEDKYEQIILLGHSEGSLICLLTLLETDKVSKFISINGLGKKASELLKKQLDKQPDQLKEISYNIIDSLAENKKVNNVPPELYTLFRPSVQNYLISWFSYSPTELLKKINIPVLLIQGDNDLQVDIDNVYKLHNSNKKSKMIIIEKMNHIMKEPKDLTENMSSYTNDNLKISDKLINAINLFISSKALE